MPQVRSMSVASTVTFPAMALDAPPLPAQIGKYRVLSKLGEGATSEVYLCHDDFLDRERRHLVCATHGAIFRIEDGVCLAGPCQGDQLEPWPVALREGAVWDASATLPGPG